jgi:hypothetical protein
MVMIIKDIFWLVVCDVAGVIGAAVVVFWLEFVTFRAVT